AIESSEMEANTYHIVLQACNVVQMRNVYMLGDPFAVPEDPKTQPNDKPGQCGILVNKCTNAVWQTITVEGAFQQGCIVFVPLVDWKPLLNAVLMVVRTTLENSQFPQFSAAVAWKGMENLDRTRVTFIQCDNP